MPDTETPVVPPPVVASGPETGTVDPVDRDEAPELDLEKVRLYQQLRNAQKAGEAEASALKEEANALEAELVEQFAEAGMQNLNIDGQTVYLHRSTYASRCEGIDAEDVKAALRAAGADELISETVNANTLSAYVRELVDVDDAPGLPEALVDVLTLGERFAIRIKAGAKPRARPARP